MKKRSLIEKMYSTWLIIGLLALIGLGVLFLPRRFLKRTEFSAGDMQVTLEGDASKVKEMFSRIEALAKSLGLKVMQVDSNCLEIIEVNQKFIDELGKVPLDPAGPAIDIKLIVVESSPLAKLE